MNNISIYDFDEYFNNLQNTEDLVFEIQNFDKFDKILVRNLGNTFKKTYVISKSDNNEYIQNKFEIFCDDITLYLEEYEAEFAKTIKRCDLENVFFKN